jgi:hypothetical protein
MRFSDYYHSPTAPLIGAGRKEMATHSYTDLRYGVLHSADWRCRSGHLIHLSLSTIFYEDVVWC